MLSSWCPLHRELGLVGAAGARSSICGVLVSGDVVVVVVSVALVVDSSPSVALSGNAIHFTSINDMLELLGLRLKDATPDK